MAEKTKFWYLRHFNIFEGMDDRAMKRVEQLSSMQSMKSDQPIYFPDQPSSMIFFLKEGHVKISRITPQGQEMILDVVGPGEIFGELSLTEDQEGRGEIAQALDNAIICTIKKEDFESLLKSHPAFNLQITKRVGLRLRKIEERVADLVFKDVKKRIATFLVRYAEDFGKIKGGTITIKNYLTHQEIALLTGAARQTVTSTLNEFRSMGILDFSRKEITISQFETLKSLSK